MERNLHCVVVKQVEYFNIILSGHKIVGHKMEVIEIN